MTSHDFSSPAIRCSMSVQVLSYQLVKVNINMKSLQYVACFHRNKGLEYLLWCPHDLMRKLLQTLGRLSVTLAYPITSCLFKAPCPFLLSFLFLALTQLCLIYQAPLFYIFSVGFWANGMHFFSFHSLLLHPLLSSLNILCPTIFPLILHKLNSYSCDTFNPLSAYFSAFISVFKFQALFMLIAGVFPKTVFIKRYFLWFWCLFCFFFLIATLLPLQSSSAPFQNESILSHWHLALLYFPVH